MQTKPAHHSHNVSIPLSPREMVYLLGIPSIYFGHRCLVTGVELVQANPEILWAVTKKLYPAIAQKLDSTSQRVERNLRTAIKICWERGNRQLLDEIAGYHLLSPPPPSEMLDLIAAYLDRISKQK